LDFGGFDHRGIEKDELQFVASRSNNAVA